MLFSHLVFAWIDPFYAFILLVLPGGMYSVYSIFLRYFILKLYSISHVRHSRMLVSFCRKQNLESEITQNDIVRRLMFYRFVYNDNFLSFSNLNKQAFSTEIAKSFMLNVASNTILIIHINKTLMHMHMSILLWFIEVAILQIVGVSTDIGMLISARSDLYRSKNHILQLILDTSRLRKKNIRDVYYQICLNNFVQIVHTKNMFAFTLGSFGKVTKRSLVAYIPMYTSFMMMMFAYISKEKK